MVKSVYCISKISRLSDAEFHRYWRDVHGPIGAYTGMPQVRSEARDTA